MWIVGGLVAIGGGVGAAVALGGSGGEGPNPMTVAASMDEPDVVAADTRVAASPDTASPEDTSWTRVLEALDATRAAIAAEDWALARDKVEAFKALDPKSAEGQRLDALIASETRVAQAYQRLLEAQVRGDREAAWSTLGTLGALPPDSVYAARIAEAKATVGSAMAEALTAEAEAAFKRKDWPLAITRGEAALAIMDGHAGATDVVARAKKKQAEASAAKSVEDESRTNGGVAPREKTGEDLYKEGRAIHSSDPSGALKLYDQAARKGYPVAYKMIGSIKIQKGDNSGAIDAYKRYLAQVPSAKDAETVRDIILRLGGTP